MAYLRTSYVGTANPAADIIALIEAQLTAAGWVFVEQATYVQSTVPRYLRVWRCPGTLNKSGTDFHVGLVRNQSAGPFLAARAFEGYNLATHTIQRPCVSGVANAPPVADGSAGSGDWPLDNSASPPYAELVATTPLATSTNYDVGVLAARSYLVVNVQPLGSATMGLSWLLGLFAPAYSDAQTTAPPLVALDLRATAGTALSGASRALRTSPGSGAFAVLPFPESVPLGLFTGAAAEPSTGVIRASRVAVGGGGASNGFTGPGATYRGWLYDAVAVATGGSAAALRVGDSAVIGPTTYTALGSSPAAQAVVTGSSGWFFDTAANS